MSAPNNKVNGSLKNHVTSSDENISFDETEIEQIKLEDLANFQSVAKNDKPPLDPFFDETNTLGYAVKAVIAENSESTEAHISTNTNANIKKQRSFFYKYRYAILAAVSIVIIVIVTAMYFNNEYNLVKKWDQLVYPGVTINGKSYAGLTKEGLVKALNEEFGDQMDTKTITIKSSGQSNAISFASLNPAFNTEEVADEAFNFMKDKGFFSKVNQIVGKNKESLSLTLKYNFDLEELKNFIGKTAEIIKTYPEDASIKIEDNSIKITDEVNGQVLKTDEIFNTLKSLIEESTYDNIEVEAIVDNIVPRVTRETLSKINGKLSSSLIYKYQYNYNLDILSNIQKVSNKLNGLLIHPGEQFSFNDVIGNPYTSSEYKLVKKTVNGKLKEDYFGLSESAAVLFDAILRAGIIPIERCRNDEPLDYVDFGLEAIIDYGNADLKFTNNFDSPIYIESDVQNGSFMINIYSDISELQGQTYTPVVEDITESTGTTISRQTINDPTLEEGKTELIQTALPKKEVSVILRTTDQNGRIVNETELYKQRYDGRPEQIRRGTKKVSDDTDSTTTRNTTMNTTTNTTNARNTSSRNSSSQDIE